MIDRLEELHLKECEKPLSNNVIGALPKANFLTAESKNLESDMLKCAVCQCDYEDGDEMTSMTCMHRYHTECIE
jgi:E3 ubiquitin-protein ligase BIG BROTHER-like protein